MRLRRRAFLLGVGASAVAARRRAFADGLRSQFTTEDRATLLQLAMDLFPHKRLGEAPYVAVIDGLLKGEMPAPRLKNFKDGLTRLDAGGATPWRERRQSERIAQIKNIERTPFFADIRATVMVGLYANPQVAAAFGYPGASIEQGGWINRGFDDLVWLPEPS
jgi:hypothetical protein